MTRSKPWSDIENGAIAALYFDMLDSAIAGSNYNKAAMIRYAQGSDDPKDAIHVKTDFIWDTLGDRSRQSIEFKLMNCSAAHQDLVPGAQCTMHEHGYRAMPNYQAGLKASMQAELMARQLDADIATSHANEQRAGA
jgi:hypothetical protein